MSSEMDDKIHALFFRGLLWWWAVGTLLLTLFSPVSLTAVLVVAAGPVGKIAAVVFGLAIASMTLNILINDVMPQRFRFRRAKRCQWLAELAIGGVYWLFAALAVLQNPPKGTWVLILMYIGVGAFGLSSAAYSVYWQYKDAVQNDPDELA